MVDVALARKYWPAALAACIGVAVSLTAFESLRRSAEDRFKDSLAAQAELRARDIQGVLGRYEGTIEGFAASFPYAEINRERFQAYARDVFLASHLLGSGFQNVSWEPRVTAAGRASFEAAARAEGFADYRIIEPAPKGGFIPAGARDEYFPIRYFAPANVKAPFGFDLLSESDRADTVRRATARDMPSATPPIRYYMGGRGCLIFVPVFASPLGAAATRLGEAEPVGMLAFRLLTSPALDAITEAVQATSRGLEMYVLDDGAAPRDRVFYYRAADKSRASAEEIDESSILKAPYAGSSFNFAGRDWTVIVRPTPELAARAYATAGWPELALGLALTALLTFYLARGRYGADRLKALASSLQREIGERKRAEQETIHSARHDFLTGLPNRMMFLERLRQEIARVKRGESKFAVLYLDLDHFKEVNDTLGHQIGDELLKAVAERFTQGVRDTDTVARLGGDEFAVIQTALRDPADAALLAAKLLGSLAGTFQLGAHETHIDASVGIAIYAGGTGGEQETLAHADLAMYKAKGEGGGRFCFHLPEMDDEVRARAALVEDLRGGLKRGELAVRCQPQVDLASGAIVGIECLLRWQHPTRGLLPPSLFIAEAERSGLILDLDAWMLEEACRFGRHWVDEGIAPRVLSVNVSSSVLKRGALYVDILEAALARTGFPAQRLELEITETVFMETTQAHRDILSRLGEIGVRIAIDDFGTGYSSLEYLRAFPVDRIKIAQVFVASVPADPSNSAIVEAIINLATALRIPLVAEGVETGAQLEFLRTRGCAEGQGGYFSKPVALADASAMVRRGRFALALG